MASVSYPSRNVVVSTVIPCCYDGRGHTGFVSALKGLSVCIILACSFSFFEEETLIQKPFSLKYLEFSKGRNVDLI